MSDKTIKLSNSVMPLVGFGTYLISDEEAQSVIRDAFEAGYRHIDTAEGYHNEEGIGKAIQVVLSEKGINREDLFITTKLWPGNKAWGETPKTYETTLESCDKSLKKLQIDYIDLYLIHAPFAKSEKLEQWRALVDLKEQGKVKAIGVCNFDVKHFEELKEAGLPLPEINQIELHPWSQKPELISYLNSNNIKAMAYSSLVPLSTWRTEPGQDSAKSEQMKVDGEKEDSPFKLMAKNYGVSEAQVLLRWGVQQDIPVIPKSVNPARMKQNIDVFSFEISQLDMESIKSMDRGDGVAWAVGDPTKFD